MEKLGLVNSTGRQVFYLSTNSSNWQEQLPKESWLVTPIADQTNRDLFDSVVKKCLDNEVIYVCTLGKECEKFHDLFDDEILIRKIFSGQPYGKPDDFNDTPMTTWHNNFEEGFWFAISSAFEDGKDINKVVCLDLTENGYLKKLQKLLHQTNEGWLPSDE